MLPETCLSLCSGVAGLDIGLSRAFQGLRVVAYCERDPFAASALLARMEDEALEPAPVWVGDLRDLDATQFAGVDAVSAGYPCQPFSTAGKRLGDKDERHLWPEVLRIIRECRPRFVFLENVAAHLRLGFDRVLCDLAGLGFNVEWAVVSAQEAGAPHLRKRLFVLAYAKGVLGQAEQRGQPDGTCEPLADADSGRLVRGRVEKPRWEQGSPGSEPDGRGNDRGFPPGPNGDWSNEPPHAQPAVRRAPHGSTLSPDGVDLALRVDRLRCCGNAVVPAQAELAFRELLERMK